MLVCERIVAFKSRVEKPLNMWYFLSEAHNSGTEIIFLHNLSFYMQDKVLISAVKEQSCLCRN